MSRFSELILVNTDGVLLGCLPAIRVVTPWWNHAESLVDAVREKFAIDITILRLLSGEHDAAGNSHVTYLAETTSAPPEIQPWPGVLTDHPLRHPYAIPGGPAADLAWAYQCLAEKGYKKSGPAIQVRTWTLSSLWRIPVEGQTLWLKVVPPFFAHEGTVLNKLSAFSVPGLIAHENGRILLAEIPGEDFYEGATPDQFRAMIALLVDIQASFIGRENELLADGLPDFRANALAATMPHVLDQTRTDLSPEDFATLEKFQTDLPQIARTIDECGIPATLVHGDFHPGNVRGTGTALTLLDWGDSGVGHPLLDQTALLRHVADSDKAGIQTYWHEAWQQRIPGSDPARAATLIKPVAALHQAIIRQTFIDNIEPTEHFYCVAKRASWLARAAELYRTMGFPPPM